MKKTNILLGSVLIASLVNGGSVFAATTGTGSQADPNSASTPVTTTLTVPHTNTPKAPTDPDEPDKGLNEQGTVTGEDGNLGIAYYPKAFNFSGQLGASELSLSDAGENNSSPKATYNIGVKDNTHTNNHWDLTAQLTWTTGDLPGSTIQLANTNGTVMQNNNNGANNFAASDLVPQDPQVVTGQSNVSIGQMATQIMSKSNTNVGIGTYDYKLGDLGALKLNIPNATSLKAGTYSGTVTWNLSVTPGTAVGTN
ncbi:WxL domain-containing protein [Enterococcus hirae]|uniref:WxL domain-containing protein n=1 Tax=Enterococcus hirae TaxID=1354 RepID=UPI002DB6BA44|nr:WxL domain-containing protein [Enterococcus hirae]MEB7440783.1 WxL domain-containing protein [Enterococcus hirae]